MKTLGYYNGNIDEVDRMQVPFLDRACFFGDGIYDATMTRHHRIVFLEDHVDRFFNSARLLRIDIPVTKDELKELLRDLVARVDADDQFVYWQVTRGTDRRHHDFPATDANLWVMLTPQDAEDIGAPVDAITVEDTRFFHCNAKTLNLIPNVLAAQRAKEAGCYEAIFVRPDGFVTECSASNVHILKDGALITHPTDNLILPGIARKHLVALAREAGVPVDERPFTKEEMLAADEVIISHSSAGGMRVSAIDGAAVGGKAGDLLKMLQDAIVDEIESYTHA